MAALLVALGVMSVLLSAAIPAWRHQTRREREAELVFRGEQYVRAISLWERKMGPGSRPPNFDILVDQKFLRRKYKDPITGEDFQPVLLGQLQNAGRGQPPGGRGRGSGPVITPEPPQQPPPFGGGRGGAVGGGIVGVRSKSTETSIRIYKGATRYIDWRFDHAGAATAPGGGPVTGRPGGPGAPTPGTPGRGRGGRGMRPGGPGLDVPPPGRRGGRGQ